jgi:hypothetical protein
MTDEEIEEQEAERAEDQRLMDATEEQRKLGPKGLHPDAEFDSNQWQKFFKDYRRGVITLTYSDLLILVWCRIHLSVVTMASDTMLIHYSFENLYDGKLPVNLEDSLFAPRDFNRNWITRDITTGESSNRSGRPYLTGLCTSFRRKRTEEVNIVISPTKNDTPNIATVTRRFFREEDGSWFLDGFGKCLPGHTYELQLIYGNVPSNVFTWTVPG